MRTANVPRPFPVLPPAEAVHDTQRVAEQTRAALTELEAAIDRAQGHRARIVAAVRTFDAPTVLRLLEAGTGTTQRFDLGYRLPEHVFALMPDQASEREVVDVWRSITPRPMAARPELDGLLVELVQALGALHPATGLFHEQHVLFTAHLLVSVGCRDRVLDGVPLRDLLHQAWLYKHDKKPDALVVQAVLNAWLKPPRKPHTKRQPSTSANTNPNPGA
ncbi:hypothetical protein BBJ41_01215 [Burkholderia stabilis]|uniref:hypothetical protein n=1 Tax=Burkholderia stabilis TaxID=95485 RepID=UPI0008519BD0|nr:hypothetical protein [Burkholderia stabilis]AOR66285.1 hypothetical protein BBJ41_01215 [Burkholderia stabilis]HDR9491905.1 hypothetical protein [Burkholderia stabilis]HDR9524061.1 hypothetical protein [Burkholderia stabilis]HDR9530632.1 hypothetical protein [Burkholderia stabilis]HDR9539362.1 hypothetical protein [Burkholderia stabilis]